MISKDELNNIKLVCFDFDGVFTNNFVYVDQNGIESVRCLRSDGTGIERIKRMGIAIYIISSEENPVVTTRAKKLNLPVMQGVLDKGSAIEALCIELNISISQSMFVGNDINDIAALKSVKYPVGVADSFPEIERYIVHKTSKKGGEGAVREVCDMIYFAIQEKDIS
jgi:3-deoxy-D-manno-octulosonate 8-phosphate phosphatase (KDO 8-P phosphatase)